MEEVVAKQLASSAGKIGLKWSNQIALYEIHQLSMSGSELCDSETLDKDVQRLPDSSNNGQLMLDAQRKQSIDI